jgi:nitrite reductase (NO-forming)
MKFRFTALAALVLFMAASCGSDQPKEEATTAAPAAAAAPTGLDIYKRSCASCHMAAGEGIENVYPPLAYSDYLKDKTRAIHQVINGSSGEIVVNGKKYNNSMPAQQLNDEEIAAVLTYVYSCWDNGGATVTAAEVKAVRDAK